MIVGVIGMGYVGKPLAKSIHAQTNHTVFGVDILPDIGQDCDFPVYCDEYGQENLAGADAIIVCLPTDLKPGTTQPDVEPLMSLADELSQIASEGQVFILESTVYPGFTEEWHARIGTGHVAYSPERIVPGEPKGELHGAGRTLANTTKLYSGNSTLALDCCEAIYKSITGDLHECTSIKVAEAAKLMENIQRDVNIALMNEMAQELRGMGVSVHDVIDAAKTKWNFHPYTPGLVGGHCIGIDPWYFVSKAKGACPIIGHSRVTNNQVVYTVSNMVPEGASVIQAGLTFKANCDDLRNSLSARVFDELSGRVERSDILDVTMWDPHIGIEPDEGNWDTLLITVGHDEVMEHLSRFHLPVPIKSGQFHLVDPFRVVPAEIVAKLQQAGILTDYTTL